MIEFPLRVRQHDTFTEVTCSGRCITVLLGTVWPDIELGQLRNNLRELIEHARTCPANLVARLEAERLRPTPPA